MPEGLVTSDGKPVNLDQEFARAMAQPDSQEPTAQKPPRKDGSDNVQTTPRKPRTRRDAPRVEKPAPKPSALSPEALAKQRSDGVKGAVQVISILPAILYQTTENKAWYADTLTLNSSADALADACVKTAEANPSFAKLVDYVSQVGPYGALASVAIGITVQLAANHGSPLGKMFGGTDPDELIKKFEEETADAGNPPGAV